VNLATGLSPALWDLLVHARLQAGPALELFDEEMRPVFDASADPRIAAVRNAATVEFYGDHHMSFAHVLTSGVDAQMRMGQWRMAVLPIRTERSVVGLLVATTPAVTDASDKDAAAALAHARVWRTAIEEDLQRAERVQALERRAQRAAAVARFAVDIQESDSEEQLVSAILQALSVWYGVDARAYRRDVTGSFVLHSGLPGIDATPAARALTSLPKSWRSIGPSGRAGQLGPDAGSTEWSLLVRSGASEEWVLTPATVCPPPADAGLEALLEGFSAALQRVRTNDVRALQRALDDVLNARPLYEPLRTATDLLAIICRHVNAVEARWTTNAGSASTPPYLGQASALSLPLNAGRERFSEIHLRRADEHPFFPSDLDALGAISPFLSAWLCGGGGHLDWTISIEPAASTASAHFHSTAERP
jgi:hypothetical protein